MSWVGSVVGTIGGLAGMVSAYVAWDQWRRVNKKIGMITDASEAAEILPAWYTSRMMSDTWLFGLLTSTGQMVVITRITALSDDRNWMDVELAERTDLTSVEKNYRAELICAVGPDRRRASVQISNIVAAIDLWSS